MSSENAAPVRADAPSSDSFDLRARFPHTLPVWPVDEDGHCTCYLGVTCRRPGKHADAQAPADAPGYAVLAGPGGVLVVDVDIKGGIDGFAQLKEWDLPPTLEVHTPSGGRHLFYSHPGIELANKKLNTAIDVRANARSDGGHAYVIGPGSPGYLKTADPCTAAPGDPYEIAEDAPIAPCPEILVAWLKLDAEQENTAPVTPIAEDHPAWDLVCRLFASDCATYEPSREDGQGSAAMMAIVRRGARRYQLPDDKALELLAAWNSRCTRSDGATPYPWDDADLLRALERSRASGPGEGMADELLAREEGRDLAWKMRLHARSPNATPEPPDAVAKVKVGAGFANDGERQKLTKTALASMLYNWPAWDGVFGYDVLRHKPIAIDPPVEGHLDMQDGREPTDRDLSQIELWFDAMGFLVSKPQIKSAIDTVIARPDRRRNFIAEYLDSLEPATDSRHLDTLATDVLGATEPFANTLLKKTLVGAAMRARKPGVPHKGMLVLKGEQFCGKTPFVKILAGDWYHSTGNGNIADRDTILECQGKWLVEVEELSALGKADANALKTAISREVDVITKKYIADGERYERSFVLVGTTNKDEFLTDETGNGRYYVIEIPRGKKIDLDKLAELRDTIWAEADYVARNSTERWNELTEDEIASLEEANANHVETHPWDSQVEAFLRGKKEVGSASEVLLHILKGDATKADKRSKNDVAVILRRLGCVARQGREGGGKKRKYWEVPAGLAERETSNDAKRETSTNVHTLDRLRNGRK